MKKYFKRAVPPEDSELGAGMFWIEYDGEQPTRQVERYGDQWFSSRDEYEPGKGGGSRTSRFQKSILDRSTRSQPRSSSRHGTRLGARDSTTATTAAIPFAISLRSRSQHQPLAPPPSLRWRRPATAATETTPPATTRTFGRGVERDRRRLGMFSVPIGGSMCRKGTTNRRWRSYAPDRSPSDRISAREPLLAEGP